MRTSVWTSVLGAVAALAVATPSHAGIERTGSGTTETIQCNGESVEIGGSANSLTLLGDCPHVEIAGTGNNVRIARAKHIEVAGVNNKVTWGEGISGRPHIESVGLGNVVQQGTVAGAAKRSSAGTSTSRGRQSGAVASDSGASVSMEQDDEGEDQSVTLAGSTGKTHTVGTQGKAQGQSATVASGGAAPTAAAIDVAGNHRKATLDCAGGDATIGGNHNTLTLKGECGTVSIPGNYNHVSIEAVAVISTPGNFNSVAWTRSTGGKTPRIANVGIGNNVTHASE